MSIKRMMGVAVLSLAAVAPLALAQDKTSAAYKACMDTANTTVSMNECNNAEIARHDKRLNQVYKKAMAAFGPVQQGKLRDAQRAWIKYIDSNCDFYFTQTGGTMTQ